ncbi:MAG: NIPSNAP family protein [Sphingobacteriales bacterium]|nr:NIPSNAP family protein [Sphingobacteriales bacterium]OJY85619.1 MAG: NIPSNAP family containing protein [Sphingobacteriales bacterium 44-15]
MTVIFKKLLPAFIALPVLFAAGRANEKKPPREFYEIKVYHFASAAQETAIDNFLQQAYLPALHASGIQHIGVFKPLSNDTAADKRIYVFVRGKSLQEIVERPTALLGNNTFTTAGKAFLNAPYNDPPFVRMENILIEAFPLAPQMNLPQLKTAKEEHVYELRSYESPTDNLFRNKVQMFNEGGEIPLFKRLGFNAVFYGSVISGSRMPNLMYMTSFDDMASREAHWNTFRGDAEWKTLSAKPEYQHNVSKAEPILMKATPYSDF